VGRPLAFAAVAPLRRHAPWAGEQGSWLVLAALLAALGGAAFALAAYALGPAIPAAALAAAALVAAAAMRPALGVAGGMLLVPFEFAALPLPTGSLSPSEAAFVLVGAGYVARALVNPGSVARPAMRDLPIAVLLLVVGLGLGVAEDPAPVARVLILWACFAAVYLQAQSFTEREMRLVIAALVVGVGILGVIGAYTYLASGEFGLSDQGETTMARAAGTFVSANAYASLLALGLLPGLALALAALPRRAWLLPLLGAALAGLAFSLSRGGMVGFAAGALLLLVWNRARYLALGAAVAIATLTIAGANPLANSDQVEIVQERVSTLTSGEFAANLRPLIWRTSLEITEDNPVIGVGVNQFQHQAVRRGLFERGQPLENAHSIPLSLAAETGLVGLVAFLVFAGMLVARAARALGRGHPATMPLALGLSAALLAFAVQGLTIVQLRNPVLTAVFFTFAGMLTALADRAGARPEEDGEAPDAQGAPDAPAARPAQAS
jgi:putative inorganic carbon (HCO3(-)) transporter